MKYLLSKEDYSYRILPLLTKNNAYAPLLLGYPPYIRGGGGGGSHYVLVLHIDQFKNPP